MRRLVMMVFGGAALVLSLVLGVASPAIAAGARPACCSGCCDA